MRIVVLAGGLSAERDVSLSTGTMVCNALRSAGQDAVLIDLFYGVEKMPEDIGVYFADKTPLEPYRVKSAAPDLKAIRDRIFEHISAMIGGNRNFHYIIPSLSG